MIENHPKEPTVLIRTLLLMILSLVTTIFFLQKNLMRQAESRAGRNQNVSQTTMALTPIVSTPFPLRKAPPEPITKQVKISKNQTFSQLMQAEGFDAGTIHDVFTSSKDLYNLSRIGAGKNILITTNPDHSFVKLQYSLDPLQTLIINRQEENIQAEMQKFTPVTTITELGGHIEGSLYSTIDRLGENDDLVIRFAEIFEWDVDFFRDLQPGDTFRIIYEKQTVEGQPYGFGRILAAELVNKGRTLTAIGYQQGSNWEYFSPDGKAMKKAFLAAPLKFTRISSGFTTHRYHPVLKTFRAHYGIDYAAPAGTPVRAIGKGRVLSAGWAGGAGKMIKLQHDQSITTAYCHLSRFASGITRGASVSQGQIIGYVGSTGLATGPHLDFRFMKNGQYVNWLTIKTPQAEPLNSAEIARFQKDMASMIQRLTEVQLQHTSRIMAYTPPSAPQLSE